MIQTSSGLDIEVDRHLRMNVQALPKEKGEALGKEAIFLVPYKKGSDGAFAVYHGAIATRARFEGPKLIHTETFMILGSQCNYDTADRREISSTASLLSGMFEVNYAINKGLAVADQTESIYLQLHGSNSGLIHFTGKTSGSMVIVDNPRKLTRNKVMKKVRRTYVNTFLEQNAAAMEDLKIRLQSQIEELYADPTAKKPKDNFSSVYICHHTEFLQRFLNRMHPGQEPLASTNLKF